MLKKHLWHDIILESPGQDSGEAEAHPPSRARGTLCGAWPQSQCPGGVPLEEIRLKALAPQRWSGQPGHRVSSLPVSAQRPLGVFSEHQREQLSAIFMAESLDRQTDRQAAMWEDTCPHPAPQLKPHGQPVRSVLYGGQCAHRLCLTQVEQQAGACGLTGTSAGCRPLSEVSRPEGRGNSRTLAPNVVYVSPCKSTTLTYVTPVRDTALP